MSLKESEKKDGTSKLYASNDQNVIGLKESRVVESEEERWCLHREIVVMMMKSANLLAKMNIV